MPEDQHDIIRDEASEIIKGFGYRANQAHCAIEAKPPVLWHKGLAAEYILSHNFGENWRSNVKVLFAGDDTTDEDVFELLQGTGVTFRVTKDPLMQTKATYKVPSTESVTQLLQWVEKKFENWISFGKFGWDIGGLSMTDSHEMKMLLKKFAY